MYSRNLNKGRHDARPHLQQGWFSTTYRAARIFGAFWYLGGIATVLLWFFLFHIQLGWR